MRLSPIVAPASYSNKEQVHTWPLHSLTNSHFDHSTQKAINVHELYGPRRTHPSEERWYPGEALSFWASLSAVHHQRWSFSWLKHNIQITATKPSAAILVLQAWVDLKLIDEVRTSTTTREWKPLVTTYHLILANPSVSHTLLIQATMATPVC